MTFRWISTALLIAFSAAMYGQEQGSISIQSTPAGCWVRIDSVLVGKTPLENLTLSAGPHTVQVYPPQNGVWNLEERIYSIMVENRKSHTVEAIFNTPVYINSIPYGASLLADTTVLGVTPVYIPFESNRDKSFRLEKEGFKPYPFVLTSNRPLLAELETDEGYAETREKPQLFGMIPKRHIKSKFTLLAATVATHWASFYFKNQADSYYEKYTQTGDASLRGNYWDKTRRYDRLSEITLGVSYASLAGLIYIVIWK